MTKINVYDRGDKLRFTAVFKDDLGADADPGTVTLKVKAPSGAVTTHADTVRDSAGHYHFDLSITESGTWTYRWEGANGVETASETQFFVRKGAF